MEIKIQETLVRFSIISYKTRLSVLDTISHIKVNVIIQRVELITQLFNSLKKLTALGVDTSVIKSSSVYKQYKAKETKE